MIQLSRWLSLLRYFDVRVPYSYFWLSVYYWDHLGQSRKSVFVKLTTLAISFRVTRDKPLCAPLLVPSPFISTTIIKDFIWTRMFPALYWIITLFPREALCSLCPHALLNILSNRKDPSCWSEAAYAHVESRSPHLFTAALARLDHTFFRDESILMNWFPSTLNSMSTRVNPPCWWINFSPALKSMSVRENPPTRLSVLKWRKFHDMDAPWECGCVSCVSIGCPWIVNFVAARFFGSNPLWVWMNSVNYARCVRHIWHSIQNSNHSLTCAIKSHHVCVCVWQTHQFKCSNQRQ